MQSLYHFLERALSLAVLAGAAPAVNAQTSYLNDDGTAESAVSYAFANDFCWMARFQAAGGDDTISAVQAAFADAQDGQPVTLCVWDDPDDDGNPTDGYLLSATTSVVGHAGTDAFTTYPVPPAMVHGVFFVGAFLTIQPGGAPGPLDTHTAQPGLSWFAVGHGPGTFDPMHVASYAPAAIDTLALHGAFLLRAQGTNVAAQEIVRVGTPPNPTWFYPGVTSGPVLGHVWDPVVKPPVGAFGAFLWVNPAPGAAVNVPTVFGTLLCLGSPSIGLFFSGAPWIPFQVAVPPTPALAGVSVTTQGAAFESLAGIRLYNALDLVLGNY